jgi:hypothetical protein
MFFTLSLLVLVLEVLGVIQSLSGGRTLGSEIVLIDLTICFCDYLIECVL